MVWGFPKNYNISDSDSLGLKIVYSLTEQINGEIEIKISDGTKFIIKFKEEDYNKGN